MNGSRRRLALVVVALATTLVVGAFPALAASPPSGALPAAITASPSQAEPLPDMFYASAAIPSGKTQTDIYDRRVTPNSLIFLTVDTTAWPGPDLSLPGLEVTVRQDGFFQVATLDNSQAPPPGINFTYAVFNSFSFGGFTVGSGTIPAGVHKVGVPIPVARSTSAVILTVDRQLPEAESTLAAVPGVKLSNHGNRFITVTTLDDSAAPVPIPFNWMLFNKTVTIPGRFPADGGCQPTCGTGTIPVGVPNVAISNSSLTSPSGVLLTVDVTSYHRDIGVPGVKVNNHGSGFFTVTTDREQPVQSSASNGLPFQYFILQPPAAWEELGPTGRSGNTETIAAARPTRHIPGMSARFMPGCGRRRTAATPGTRRGITPTTRSCLSSVSMPSPHRRRVRCSR